MGECYTLSTTNKSMLPSKLFQSSFNIFLYNFIQTFKCLDVGCCWLDVQMSLSNTFRCITHSWFLKVVFPDRYFLFTTNHKAQTCSMRHQRISDFLNVCVRIVTTVLFPHVIWTKTTRVFAENKNLTNLTKSFLFFKSVFIAE